MARTQASETLDASIQQCRSSLGKTRRSVLERNDDYNERKGIITLKEMLLKDV